MKFLFFFTSNRILMVEGLRGTFCGACLVCPFFGILKNYFSDRFYFFAYTRLFLPHSLRLLVVIIFLVPRKYCALCPQNSPQNGGENVTFDLRN